MTETTAYPEGPGRRPDGEHFVAEIDETGLGAVDAVDDSGAPSSVWGEAWQALRRRPTFWISAALIVLVCTVAAFPGLFTSQNPRFCELGNSLGGPASGHPFGFDRQGCDIYTRVVHGDQRFSFTRPIVACAGPIWRGASPSAPYEPTITTAWAVP